MPGNTINNKENSRRGELSVLLKDLKYSKKSSKKMVPGIYDATITYAGDNPEYVEGEAFEIRYKLLDENGYEYAHRETFFNDLDNARTAEFEEYLQQNGMTLGNPSALIGCKERLEFKKHNQNGRTYLNVVKREFVPKA